MGILLIIDTRWNTVYAQQPWHGYAHCTEAVFAKIGPLGQSVLTLGPQGDLPADQDSTPLQIYTLLRDKTQKDDILIYVYADEPFIDTQLAAKMLENHQKYFADFSFAEGYPQGLAPLIISQRILPDLIELAQEKKDYLAQVVHIRNFFFQTIKQDLNRFSIETEISPIDVRVLRLQLNYENKNNSLICQKILQAGATDAQSILKTVQDNPELLWGCPVYYNIQISTNCPQKCSYCPYRLQKNFGQSTFMTRAQLKTLLRQAQALSGEAVISLSYMGEAALHKDFAVMMQDVLSIPDFSLHVETSGIGWNEEAWRTLLDLDRKRISLILSLDSHEESVYKKVRGEGFEEAMAFADKCLQEFKENTWIQSVRHKAVEPYLESFYRYFHEKGAQVIIQKYDNFCGSLPDEKPVNIAPLQRHVCWAIQREMSILVDGNIHLCRSDLAGNIPLGNAFNDNLQTIWDKMEPYRCEHAKKTYPKICENCDEYYIFNF